MNKQYRNRLLTFIGTILGIVLWIIACIFAGFSGDRELFLWVFFIPMWLGILFVVVALISNAVYHAWQWVNDAKR